jgi:hypothetical protein
MNNVDQFGGKPPNPYFRMLLGGVIGGGLTFVCGYLWAWSINNLNPVSGFGLVVLSVIGVVIGVLASLFSSKWQQRPQP